MIPRKKVRFEIIIEGDSTRIIEENTPTEVLCFKTKSLFETRWVFDMIGTAVAARIEEIIGDHITESRKREKSRDLRR